MAVVFYYSLENLGFEFEEVGVRHESVEDVKVNLPSG